VPRAARAFLHELFPQLEEVTLDGGDHFSVTTDRCRADRRIRLAAQRGRRAHLRLPVVVGRLDPGLAPAPVVSGDCRLPDLPQLFLSLGARFGLGVSLGALGRQ
jgi:hypothetical protein